MVKKLAVIFLLCSARFFAQETKTFTYKSMLKASATLCPGFMTGSSQNNIYVHGHLEYFPEDRVSLRGEGFWFTGAQQKPAILKENSGFMFGALYHFHKNRLDYFVGIQTGASFTKPNPTTDSATVTTGGSAVTTRTTTDYNLKVVPVFSPFTGITFYPGRYVNFFLELRYVNGRYFGYNGGRLDLGEIRFSAGLGFQLPLKKAG
jgi:hypothetical protein